MKRSPTALALTLLGALASGCSHLATFSDGATVRFEAARLNGAPVERSTATIAGHRVTTERAWFVYELEERWHSAGLVRWSNVQAAWTVTVEAPFVATEAFRATLANGLATRLVAEVPGSNCEPLPSGAMVTCQWPLPDGAVGHARWQVHAAPRGVLVQLGTWSTARGTAWVEAFLRSATATPGTGEAPNAELESVIAAGVTALSAP